ETALAAQDHQDLPFEQVVEIVQPPRRLNHTPVFQVMFVWQNNDQALLDLSGVTVQAAGTASGTVRFDLELVMYEEGGGIGGGLNYVTALFDEVTIQRQIGYLITMLKAMVADSGQAVTRIDLLPAEERGLLLETWNATEAAYPKDLCVHQLFEEQVGRSPQ